MLFPADYVAFDLGPTIEYGGHYLIAGYNVAVGYYPTVTINKEAGSGTLRSEQRQGQHWRSVDLNSV